MRYLGIDTSNYTTSAAVCGEGFLVQKKRLLPVRQGQLGLRQSDAVFEHTRALPKIIESCFEEAAGGPLSAVGVSARPRDEENSYMPCFLAGVSAARAVAASWGVACHSFSHQAGHAAAALYATGRTELFAEKFLCLHFSGGTTDCLLVTPDSERVLSVSLLYTSLDLKAGQAVDRVGALLGLPFPAGEALSALAQESDRASAAKPVLREGNVSLSGLQNQCEAKKKAGEPPEDIAHFCLATLAGVAGAMTEAAQRKEGELPVIFAGGVMASSVIRNRLAPKFGGAFCDPAFSSDNAAGAAVLARQKEEMG